MFSLVDIKKLSPNDWHHRFTLQASWTADLRKYLFNKSDLKNAKRILDVGCGTGVIISELNSGLCPDVKIHGLDLDHNFLNLASQHSNNTTFIEGNALVLPFETNSFDITFCHYFLLWVSDPMQVVTEMARVTKSGGCVLAIAEPDYGGRIDYPEPLGILGYLQKISLFRLGANPQLGRQLGAIFRNAGLTRVEIGVLGGQWKENQSREEFDSEWDIIIHDLGNSLPQLEIDRLRKIVELAWQNGERLVFVPTFYAWSYV